MHICITYFNLAFFQLESYLSGFFLLNISGITAADNQPTIETSTRAPFCLHSLAVSRR